MLIPMAIIVGTLCAGFLEALDGAARIRFQHPALLFALPFAGCAVGYVYHRLGRSAEGGNNLIVEQIHEPGGGVPLRMAPLILIATVISHLFGASVGREGTAVQVGGSIASGFCRALRLTPQETRILLMAGIAAGFGAVFGTPVAGAVFALEVLTVGRVEYAALVPAILAAIVADWTCHRWGVQHITYAVRFAGYTAPGGAAFHVDPVLLVKVALASVAFGLASLLFSEATHRTAALFKQLCPTPWLRPAIGGVLTILLVMLLGTRDYLGLGVIAPSPGGASIVNFFGPHLYAWSWAWKIVFTVLAISTGFKGGEVTPLFFIGAALGNALSGLLAAPVDLFAGLGFVAIFAGAANTPLACTLMGIELFGATNAVYVAVACFVAYLCSGHSGIYLSQRIGVPKIRDPMIPPDISLRHARDMRPPTLGGLASPFVRASRAEADILVFPNQESSDMSRSHALTSTEVGMIRIYMKPRERHRQTGAGRIRAALAAKPLYQELVLRAKQAGLVNATAHHTHFGFSNHGPIQDHTPEIANPELTMCVELIGAREALEGFCREQGALLQGKIIVYKHLEHWSLAMQPAGDHLLMEEDIEQAEELLTE